MIFIIPVCTILWQHFSSRLFHFHATILDPQKLIFVDNGTFLYMEQFLFSRWAYWQGLIIFKSLLQRCHFLPNGVNVVMTPTIMNYEFHGTLNTRSSMTLVPTFSPFYSVSHTKVLWLLRQIAMLWKYRSSSPQHIPVYMSTAPC